MRRGECFTTSYHQPQDVMHFGYSKRETYYWTCIGWNNKNLNSRIYNSY